MGGIVVEIVVFIIAIIALGMAMVIMTGQLLKHGISASLFKGRAAKISLLCLAVYAVSYAGYLFLNNG
jgi:hypothetical protein